MLEAGSRNREGDEREEALETHPYYGNCSRELEICDAGSMSLSNFEVKQRLRLNKKGGRGLAVQKLCPPQGYIVPNPFHQAHTHWLSPRY